jgi:predicted protein tyrosine phosphatase
MSAKKVMFLSKKKAQDFYPPPGAVLISISDDEDHQLRLKDTSWSRVFFHHFLDGGYDTQLVSYSGERFRDIYQSYFMPEDAEKLRHQIQDVADQTDLIVINCEYGRSRSAAVAKYIRDAYDFELDQDPIEANHTVYKILQGDRELLKAIRESDKLRQQLESPSLLRKVANWLGFSR